MWNHVHTPDPREAAPQTAAPGQPTLAIWLAMNPRPQAYYRGELIRRAWRTGEHWTVSTVDHDFQSIPGNAPVEIK